MGIPYRFSYLIVTKRESDFHCNPMWRQSVGEYCRRRDEGNEQLVLQCILLLLIFSIDKSVFSSCSRNLHTRDSDGPTCRSARRNAVKVTICGCSCSNICNGTCREKAPIVHYTLSDWCLCEPFPVRRLSDCTWNKTLKTCSRVQLLCKPNTLGPAKNLIP